MFLPKAPVAPPALMAPAPAPPALMLPAAAPPPPKKKKKTKKNALAEKLVGPAPAGRPNPFAKR